MGEKLVEWNLNWSQGGKWSTSLGEGKGELWTFQMSCRPGETSVWTTWAYGQPIDSERKMSV